MPANALSEGDIFDLSSESNIITSFKFESTFNVMANLVGGMYNSRLLTYDPITMRVGAIDNEGAYASASGSSKFAPFISFKKLSEIELFPNPILSVK